MRTTATFLLAVLLCAGCGPKATTADCQPACDRVAKLRVAPKKKGNDAALHEVAESLERVEDTSADNIKLLKQQLAEGGPPFDEKAVRKLPAAKRKALLDRHAYEAAQLKAQREHAIEVSEQAVVDAKKQYETAKKRAEDDLAKATADAAGACMKTCVERRQSHAQCLGRVQAVEDIAVCDQQ